MTAVISGTNGLLQSYDYQVLTTGFTYTFAAGTQVLVINPAGTLATGTITMPAAPVDGMTITFSSSQQITALTLNGNTGQSINGAVTFLPAKTAVAYVYRATGATWWPTQSVPGTGSQLVSGTSQASTSGTSIDFTGIPSWAKRITVMFNGVSISGASVVQIQLGSGSPTTSGYLCNVSSVAATANTTVTNTVTTGFAIVTGAQSSATNTLIGALVLTNISSNIWVGSGTILANSGGGTMFLAGNISLSGTLDRVRITTVNGTDTFDAGSINILYE